jgi:general secretion pathway protein D
MARLARPIAIIVALWFLFVAGAARAGEVPDEPSEDDVLYGCGKPKGKFTVSFKADVELKDLVTWAMGFSCKKFLYTSAVASRSSKVTIVTPGTLSKSEAWHLFQAALAGMGLTVVEKGAVLEIVESASAKGEALEIRKTFPDGGADVVRLLLKPEHVAVDDLRAALELVRSAHGAVAALPNLHAILVTDDSAHIARMKTLVGELDQPTAGDAVYAIPLEHVDAAAVATTVETLLGADGKAKMRLVADARLNALFLAGTAADYLRVRALARAIDVDTGDTAQVHLVKLSHAQAKDVAAALQPMLGEAKVAADEASNSLLILASVRDAASLEAVIEEMDVARRQVYLEALVLEVESSNTLEVGASWHVGKVDGSGTTWAGAQETGGMNTLSPAATLGALDGALGGVFGPEVSLLGQTIPSLGLMIKATRHTSRLDVLSSPHLMTVDNQKATISVGSNIPYKSSSGGVSATGAPLPDNVQRQKVALTLAVTPHVSPAELGREASVRLEISLESAQLGSENFGDNLGPTWKERSIETTVVLRDQESIVLGGLVDERIEDVVTGIPFLSDIPVIGALFRQSKKQRLKSNLLVILTPHLVDDTVAGRELLARRMAERDEFLRAADDLERRVLSPDIDYRKKRGLVADIDATIEAIERDRATLAASRSHPTVPEGPLTEHE